MESRWIDKRVFGRGMESRQAVYQAKLFSSVVQVFYAHCADGHEAGRVYKDLPELLQRTGVVQEPGSRSDASNGVGRDYRLFPP